MPLREIPALLTRGQPARVGGEAGLRADGLRETLHPGVCPGAGISGGQGGFRSFFPSCQQWQIVRRMASEDRSKITDVLLDGLAVQVTVDPPSRPEMVPHVRGYASQVTGESVDGGLVECRRVFEEIVFVYVLEYFAFDQLPVEVRQFFEIPAAR